MSATIPTRKARCESNQCFLGLRIPDLNARLGSADDFLLGSIGVNCRYVLVLKDFETTQVQLSPVESSGLSRESVGHVRLV